MSAQEAAAALRRPLAALSPSPELRPRLLAALAGVVMLFALYMFWFRDSGFVSVDRVTVSGLTGSESGRLQESLTASAQTMSTLHVDRDRLARVVATFPVVERIQVEADFPHALRITVIEHKPTAVVVSGRSKVAVSAEGGILRGLPATGSLPQIKLDGALPANDRLARGAALSEALVAGAAPDPLRRRVVDVTTSGRGLIAHVRGGPDLIFGNALRLHAKWAAIAAVLADRASRGADYIDVRLPERPAAGGLPVNTVVPVAPAGEPQVQTPPTATTPQAQPAPTTTQPNSQP